MMIILAAIGAMETVRQALVTQQYERLAKLAAESGINYAARCLKSNDQKIDEIWPHSNSVLRADTNCRGEKQIDKDMYIQNDGRLRTSFSVPKAVDNGKSVDMTARGTVELRRKSDGAVYRSYIYDVNARFSNMATGPKVLFGYLASQVDPANYGGFFATIDSGGNMLTAGLNANGQLGTGSKSRASPVPEQFKLPDPNLRVVAAYTNFLSQGTVLLARTSDGQLWGAGYNDFGQLGTGRWGNGGGSSDIRTPQRFLLPAGEIAEHVTIQGQVTLVITESGRVYSSGKCSPAREGDSATGTSCVSNVYTPRLVEGLPEPVDDATTPVEMISDAGTVFLRTKGGAVYGWGQNLHGELGQGDCEPRRRAVRVGTFGNAGRPKAKQVIFDGGSMHLLDDRNETWSAGRNVFGQLGVDRGLEMNSCPSANRGDIIREVRPYIEKVWSFEERGIRVKKIASDQQTLVALGTDGVVYSIGLNNAGQFGDPTATISRGQNFLPHKFRLPAGVTAVDIAHASQGEWGAPYNNTYVIGSDNKVYGAGSNVFGQIGNGSSGSANYVSDPPVAGVMLNIDGVDVKALNIQTGYGTTIVTSESGSVYTVGRNNTGQLGDGTTIDSPVPEVRKYTNPEFSLVYY